MRSCPVLFLQKRKKKRTSCTDLKNSSEKKENQGAKIRSHRNQSTVNSQPSMREKKQLYKYKINPSFLSFTQHPYLPCLYVGNRYPVILRVRLSIKADGRSPTSRYGLFHHGCRAGKSTYSLILVGPRQSPRATIRRSKKTNAKLHSKCSRPPLRTECDAIIKDSDKGNDN